MLNDASPLLFKAAIDRLVQERRLGVDQEIVHIFDRAVMLGGEEQRIRQLLTERFTALGLQATSPDEVIAALQVDRRRHARSCRLMIKGNELVKINDEMTVDAQALAGLVTAVRAEGHQPQVRGA